MKSKENKTRKYGFALFSVVLLLLLMSATGIAMLTMSRREKQLEEYKQRRTEIRKFALSAAKIALARLQEISGPDSVSTSAPPNKDFPHVAWNVKNPPSHFPEKISPDTPVPLCSGNDKSDPDDLARIPPDSGKGKQLSAPWEYIGNNFRFAYLIIDESQKFPLLPPRKTPEQKSGKSREEEQEQKQLLNVNHVIEGTDPEELNFAQYDPEIFFDQKNFKNLCKESSSIRTFGVIADWQRNRLKKDLSDKKYFDEYFPQNVFDDYKNILPHFPCSGIPVAQALPREVGKLGISLNMIPVPVDIKLHIGFFNARTDGQHRARFHITAKLWNPNSVPILAHADGQFGLIDFHSLPSFFIQNLNTNGKFSVNLSDFPTGRFGLVRQTPSDKTLNAYCKIFDNSDQGFGDDPKSKTAGMHAGEIYLARFPDPRGQPEGLSRITGGPSWKFQKNANPQKAPSKTVDGRWFHDLHRINIFSMPPIYPGEISLRHYNGPFRQSTLPENYSKAIVKIKNIQFPYADFTISGKEYNREKAGDYDITQANLVYRIRLKSEDENAMKLLIEHCDLRAGILDFSDPVIANAFEISVHTGKEAKEQAQNDDIDGYFFDYFTNEHRTEEKTLAFSGIQIYDLPNKNHASAGTLRFIHMKQLPPLSIGRFSETVKKKKINQILDRYFFSQEKRNEFSNTSENHLFVQKDRMYSLNLLEKLPESNFAEQCMIRGPFNINSVNEKAWNAILSNTILNWEQYSGRHERRAMPWDRKNSPQNMKNIFFSRPFSAQFISPDGKIRALTDSDLETAPQRSREQFLLGQGLRSIRPEQISALSKFLSTEISKQIAERKPFLSVSDFADSGLLDKGINHAGINIIGGKKIPAWFPDFLKQEHIIESLVLRASPRGDSFSIIVKAEQINPLTRQIEAGASLKMQVQRIPDLFDSTQNAGIDYSEYNAKNKRFGRRFKIVSFKFL